MHKFSFATAALVLVTSAQVWAKTDSLAFCDVSLLASKSQNNVTFTTPGETHDLLPAGQSVQWSAQLSGDGKSLKITHYIISVAPAELESVSLPLISGASFEIKQTTFSDSVAPYSFVCKAGGISMNAETSGLRNDSGDLIYFQTPIQFSIERSVPTNTAATIREASVEFNKANGKKLITFSDVPTNNVISLKTTWDRSQSSSRASTTVNWSGKAATGVSVVLNGQDFDFNDNALTKSVITNSFARILAEQN